MGGTSKQVGQASGMTQQQKTFINQILQQLGPEAIQAYSQFLQPYDPEQFQDLFQKSYIDPAMKAYEQNTLPAIYESFGDANAGSSSALNQALAASAKDLSTNLGSQMGQFYQNYMGNQLGALGGFGGYATGQFNQPIVQRGYSPYGDVLSSAGKIGAAALPFVLSSKATKENIEPYTKGLSEIKNWEVSKFDYKFEYGGGQNIVGMMAEDLPQELTAEQNGLLHVNLYSLIGVLVNGIKELTDRIERMEAQHGFSS